MAMDIVHTGSWEDVEGGLARQWKSNRPWERWGVEIDTHELTQGGRC
jgi:hypothetical protein